MPRGSTLKSGKNLYTIHAFEENTPPINWKNLKELRICSIDMGRVNFGMQIETRRIVRGELEVTRELIIKRELKPAPTHGISYFYKQFTDLIYEYQDLMFDCRLILIEKQMAVVGAGKGGNVKTYRDMQHLITLFQFFPFNNPCHIVELSPRVKTKYLRCPDSIKGKQIKKWCVDKAEEIIDLIGDSKGLELIEELRSEKDKLDEIGDTICQVEAFIQLVAIDTKDDRFCLLDISD
jgi:hypothetical protein